MSSATYLYFALGVLGAILSVTLGFLLLSTRARWAGVLLISAGVFSFSSDAVWFSMMTQRMDFSLFEEWAPLIQGISGMAILARIGGVLILVLHFRNQVRRVRELEELLGAPQF